MKQELTTKSYSLKGRLRLFHGTITPTMLYGSSTWTLTVELENRLRRTQRQMLRMIVHCPRRHDTTTRNNTEPTAQDNTTTTNADNSHYVPTNTQPVTTDNDNTTSDSDSDPVDVDSNPAEQNDPPTTTTDDGETTETWLEWMRRCTHEAEDQMKTLGIEDWITEHRRRKWRWAQKVATEQLDKWSVKALL